jgi:hypothetical protein
MPITISQGGGYATSDSVYVAQTYTARNYQIGMFTTHWKTSTLTGNVSLGQIADTIQTAIDGALQPCVDTGTGLLGTKVSSVRVVPPTLPGIATSTSEGTAAPPSMSNQTSGLITWRTILAGRKYRGRIYVPFPAVVFQTVLGEPSAAYVALLDTLATILVGLTTITSLTGAGTMALGLYHRSTGEVTGVIEGVPQDKWATQRRRGNYGRLNFPSIPG